MECRVVHACVSMAFAGFTSVIAELGLAAVPGTLGLAVRTCYVFAFVPLFAGFTVPGAELRSLGMRNLAWLGLSGLSTAFSWVFCFASGKVSLTVHAVADASEADPCELAVQLRALLAERFGIHHSTVQVERAACEQAGEAHGFGPGTGEAAHAH